MVSCPRAGFCMVTNEARVHLARWCLTHRFSTEGYFVGISCSSPEFCMDVIHERPLRGSSDGYRLCVTRLWRHLERKIVGKPHEIASADRSSLSSGTSYSLGLMHWGRLLHDGWG